MPHLYVGAWMMYKTTCMFSVSAVKMGDPANGCARGFLARLTFGSDQNLHKLLLNSRSKRPISAAQLPSAVSIGAHRMPMAALSSPLRRRARTQRWAIWTATSTFASSFGRVSASPRGWRCRNGSPSRHRFG